MFPHQNLATQLQRAVQLAAPIQQMGHMLANFHALRMCETSQLLPTVNETFWNRCFSAVSEATAGSASFDRDADPELTISADLYHQNLPPNHVRPKRPAFLKDVSLPARPVLPPVSCPTLIGSYCHLAYTTHKPPEFTYAHQLCNTFDVNMHANALWQLILACLLSHPLYISQT